MKRVYFHLCLVAMLLSGCDVGTFEGDYLPITTMRDNATGLYVELAQLDTISSHGYVVQVFRDPKPRAGVITQTDAVINIAGMQDEDIHLSIRNGCYVLEAHYGFGGLITPVWRDPESGKSICFDLVPDRGPKPSKSN